MAINGRSSNSSTFITEMNPSTRTPTGRTRDGAIEYCQHYTGTVPSGDGVMDATTDFAQVWDVDGYVTNTDSFPASYYLGLDSTIQFSIRADAGDGKLYMSGAGGAIGLSYAVTVYYTVS